MHVDIHGKMDRADDMDLDVGLAPMEEEWDEDGAAAEHVKGVLGRAMEEAFDGRSLVSRKSKRRFPLTVELDPRLCGYWGHHSDSPLTISHQSVLLGIPAFQLEIPYSMRQLLVTDAAAFDAFSVALFRAIDATLDASRSGALGTGSAFAERPLEPTAAPPNGKASTRPTSSLCELELLPTVDDVWVAAMLEDLKQSDSVATHGKQI